MVDNLCFNENVNNKCKDLGNGPNNEAPEADASNSESRVNTFNGKKKKFKKRTQGRKFWLYGLSVSAPIFIASLLVGYVMLCTDLFHDEVLKHLVIREGNEVYQIWTNSQIPNIIYFHAFNYTNVDKVLSGQEKPIVVEVGPYVFREFVERVNVVDHKNGTITYQEQKSHEFLTDISNGSLDDEIYVPNIPLISSIKKDSESAAVTLVKKFALFGLQTGLKSEPFLRLQVGDFAWEFGDTFAGVTRTLATILKQAVPKKYGILAMRPGLSPDQISIGTGADLSNFGLIQRYNGKARIGLWESEACDSFHASEGSLFPGKNLTPKTKLYMYVKDFCRRLPMVYKETVTVEGFVAYRFTYPRNVFASGEENEDNVCFCNSSCLPSGVFDTQKCMYGAPIAVSFPHFLYGQKSLHDAVEGLQPDPEKHRSYMDLHNIIGLPIAGQNRFQINVYIRESVLSTYKGIPVGTVLPLAWVGFEIGELTDKARTVIGELTTKSALAENSLIWSSILLGLLSGFFIVYAIFQIKSISKSKLIGEREANA